MYAMLLYDSSLFVSTPDTAPERPFTFDFSYWSHNKDDPVRGEKEVLEGSSFDVERCLVSVSLLAHW